MVSDLEKSMFVLSDIRLALSPLKWLVFVLIAFVCRYSDAQTIYKYKDANGRWHFTDKVPNKERYERTEYKDTLKKRAVPRVRTRKRDGITRLVAENPYYGPVQFRVKLKGEDKRSKTLLVPPASSRVVYELGDLGNRKAEYRYRWTAGDPDARPQEYLYYPPVPQDQRFRISQGFAGRFSHSKEPSYYAIDIAMPVGTVIRAARPGTVMAMKDDYHMGSVRSDYFRDKANFIMVLHDDGTMATYAHILLGGALVGPGDKVKAGQPLAKSGSTGYSSGPHLHFVIRRNVGFDRRSVPFRFRDRDGKAFQPKRGKFLGND